MSRLYDRSTKLPKLNSSGQPGCARDDTFLSMTCYPGANPGLAPLPLHHNALTGRTGPVRALTVARTTAFG
jgi:hypothetical protein